MRQPIRIILSLALASVAFARATAQGTVVAGTEGRGAMRIDAEYMGYMSAAVDTLVKAWERAARARDVHALAGLYTSDAVLMLRSGALVQGRGSVYDAYERLIKRIKSPHISVMKIVASADVASVVAQLDYDVPLESGGWYPRVVPMTLTLKADTYGRLKVAIQAGGDLESLTKAEPPRAAPAPGARDSLRVRLTDVSGAGVRGVLVAFDVQRGESTVDPAAVVTDAQGYATAWLVAGTKTETTVVRVVAATLLEEPLYFSYPSGSDASAADGGEAAAATTPPPRH